MRVGALAVSFGPVAGLLIVLGAIHAFKNARWYFWFSLIAFVFVGPLFVWISDLDLAIAPSALFVLQRFFLLSQVVLAPLIAFGVLALAGFVADSLRSADSLALWLTSAACFAAIALNVGLNYRRLDQSRNFVARHFAEEVFNMVEPNSILLVNGDGLVFPLMYLHTVQKAGDNITLVAIPTLLGDWYVRQLRERYRDLIIPFDRYDGGANNLQKFVLANEARAVEIVGPIGNDNSLDADYWPCQQGLVIRVMPKTRDVPLDNVLLRNEQLIARCRPPAPETLRMNTFEADILNVYAYAPFNIGGLCERARLIPEAQHWYRRGLTINPRFTKACEALARLEH
jgi:hypothetical protein